MIRGLLGKASGKWLQRLDTGEQQTIEHFRAHVAAQFGLATSEVAVQELMFVSDAEVMAAVTALAAGLYQGLSVIAAPPPADPLAGATTVEEVDRIIATRIRTLIGGIDPIQEQLKQLRLFAVYTWALQHTTWPDGSAVTADQTTTANTFMRQAYALNQQIEQIRAAGAAVKTAKGLA